MTVFFTAQLADTMLGRKLQDAGGSGLTGDQTDDLDKFFVLLSGYLVRAPALMALSADSRDEQWLLYRNPRLP